MILFNDVSNGQVNACKEILAKNKIEIENDYSNGRLIKFIAFSCDDQEVLDELKSLNNVNVAVNGTVHTCK